MTSEEQISAIADLLFYNTSTGELSVERCYELAEKIVARTGLQLSAELAAAAKECSDNLQLQEYFRKGAIWQKEQMMKKAVEYGISDNRYLCIPRSHQKKLGLNPGDKVKIIIIPDNDREIH